MIHKFKVSPRKSVLLNCLAMLPIGKAKNNLLPESLHPNLKRGYHQDSCPFSNQYLFPQSVFVPDI